MVYLKVDDGCLILLPVDMLTLDLGGWMVVLEEAIKLFYRHFKRYSFSVTINSLVL